MKNIKLSRRNFSFGLALSLGFRVGSSIAITGIPSLAFSKAPTNPTDMDKRKILTYASAATDNNKQHWLAIFDGQGKLKTKLALPERAHQISMHPDSTQLAVAARRPGRYLFIVDAQTGKLLQHIEPESGHHFYGHSSFSLDGNYLYTTENHIDSGEGRIFVRDTTDSYKIIRSYSSHGIGPHEIRTFPNSNTLVVANGGIHTHPDSGRIKLNLDSMSPSLVYLSAETGEFLEKAKLPKDLHQLSIRHIDVNAQGITAIAMQYQGDKSDNVPLVAMHKRGDRIRTRWAPDYINRRMENYCGSVCFNKSGSIFAVTAPRGDLITLWDAFDGEFISQLRCPDVCGISQFEKHGFSFSNGLGKLYNFDMNRSILEEFEHSNNENHLMWDNHLTSYNS